MTFYVDSLAPRAVRSGKQTAQVKASFKVLISTPAYLELDVVGYIQLSRKLV